jgi:gamma-glutamyl-gamma-aminobutyrate hydrolase PuuD
MPCPHGKASAKVCPECQAAQSAKPGTTGTPARTAAPAPVAAITVAGEAPPTRSAAVWLAYLRQYAKHFTEHDLKLLHKVLDTLAATNHRARNQQEFQSTLMAMVLELRRPKINGKDVCIGIPYRDDGKSKAILEDARRITEGCLCKVVVLIPSDGLGQWKSHDLTDWVGKHGYAHLVLDETKSLRIQGLDGIYVSGGPHDHPRMSGPSKNDASATPRASEADRRHRFEEFVIGAAIHENLPVLGICGGSWRLAGAIGGQVRRLGGGIEKNHAKPMNLPYLHAHDVNVQPYTMLNQILKTDNYRTWGDAQVPQGTTLHVNSVHWAQSVFPITSPLTPVVSAKAPDTTNEGFEVPVTNSHFVMGIQWHPEYAMDQQFAGDDARQHRQVMRALGDAARDGRAATTLQAHVRGFLARNRLKPKDEVAK